MVQVNSDDASEFICTIIVTLYGVLKISNTGYYGAHDLKLGISLYFTCICHLHQLEVAMDEEKCPSIVPLEK